MAFQIPGSVIDAAAAAKAAAAAASAATAPTYAQMMETIKSGAIHKDTSAQLGALSNVGVDSNTMASIQATIDKAKANMSIDMAVANAALTQKAKEAQAAGTTLSQADKDAAMAPMSVLKNLQSTISGSMNSLKSAVSGAAGALGISVAGANPTAALNSTASAVTAFKATIPPQTIPDPENPSQTIANPAYTAFAADPTNASKISAMGSIASAVSSAGSGLLSSMNGFAAAAASAKTDTINTLKADAMLAKLTKPMPPDMAAIASNNLNLNSIDKYAAIKAQESPPTITVPKTEDQNRPGAAKILSDIPPLTNNSDNNKRIWTYELKALKTDADAAENAWMAIFGSSKTDTDWKSKRETWAVNGLNTVVGSGANDIRLQSVAIKKAKPDPSTRTDEENSIVKQSSDNMDKFKASSFYAPYKAAYDEYAKLNDWYSKLYDNWLGVDNRYVLEAGLLTKISSYPSS